MKKEMMLVLFSAAGLFLTQNSHAADIDELNDIEVEAVHAEADASMRTADAAEARAEREKFDNEFSKAEAEKAVKASESQQQRAEFQIAKAENQIAVLKQSQRDLAVRKKLAEVERVKATRKLAAMIAEVKAYRAQVKKQRNEPALQMKALYRVKASIAKLQKMKPAKVQPAKITRQVASRPAPRASKIQASASSTPARRR